MMQEFGDRRTALLDTALHRFATEGVEATSVDVVVREAGASTGSLYHHFPSKAHLVAAVYVEALRSYQRGFVETLARHHSAEAGIRGVVGFHVDWCVEHRERARMLFRERAPQPDEPGGEDLRTANRDFLERVMGWWRPHAHYGAVRDLPAADLYVLWLGPAQERCRLWLSGQADQPGAVSTQLLADAAWRALQLDTGAPQRGDAP